MSPTVLTHLPHRSPFLMVDRVLLREPGVRVVAEKLVDAADPLPAQAAPVLLLEMLAQAGGFLEPESLHGAEIFLAGLQDVHFHGRPRAGDRLRLEVRPDAAFGPITRIRGEVHREGEVLCSARLLLRKGTA